MNRGWVAVSGDTTPLLPGATEGGRTILPDVATIRNLENPGKRRGCVATGPRKRGSGQAKKKTARCKDRSGGVCRKGCVATG